MPITRRQLAAMIDHTLLKPTTTSEEISRLCQEARQHGFAAVCVNSCYVSLARKLLAGTKVKVCAVAGFPLGAAATAVKAFEAAEAIKTGASEIDMVINIGALKEGKLDAALKDIRAVVEATTAVDPQALVKVIIETCYLTGDEKVTACQLAREAGARFVKTSTGFGGGGATVEDVALMWAAVGPEMGVKASGGIKTAEQALAMIRAGASRIGTSSGVQLLESFSG